MILRLINYISFFKRIEILRYFYLNYFCKSIVRKDKSKIIPYKNAIIDIEKDAKIILEKGDIEIGCDSLKKSKKETLIRIRKNGIWESNGGCVVSYGATIEVLEHASLKSGFFTMNTNSVIVAANQIVIGNDVMMGRNVIVYDSDYHRIMNAQYNVLNPSKPVYIGNHVWIATNAMILKGVKIGSNSIIGANSVVYNDVMERVIFKSEHNFSIKENEGTWERKGPGAENC